MKKPLFASAFLSAFLLLGFAGTSSAVVIWFSGVDIPIPGTFAGVNVDLETGVSSSADLVGADANFFFSGVAIGNDGYTAAVSPSWQPIRVSPVDATVANLAVGTPIGPGGPYTPGFAGSVSHLGTEFTAGTQGIIGFSLEHSTLGTVYGWMEVTLEDFPSEGTIHRWVYQDNGNPIPAGIPEPTAPLLGALGLGFLALRRRRK